MTMDSYCGLSYLKLKQTKMYKINKKWTKDLFAKYSAQDDKWITNLFIIIDKEYLKYKVDISHLDSIELDFDEQMKAIEKKDKDIVFDNIEEISASIFKKDTIAIHWRRAKYNYLYVAPFMWECKFYEAKGGFLFWYIQNKLVVAIKSMNI